MKLGYFTDEDEYSGKFRYDKYGHKYDTEPAFTARGTCPMCGKTIYEDDTIFWIHNLETNRHDRDTILCEDCMTDEIESLLKGLHCEVCQTDGEELDPDDIYDFVIDSRYIEEDDYLGIFAK